MNSNEKGIFLKLFNRGGYVLDFSTANFDSFTMASVGVELCSYYGMSKGKSLNAFVNDTSDDLADKLLLDLLKYYETQYPNFEKERDGVNDSYSYGISNEVYGKYYAQCKEIAQRINTNQFSSFATKSMKDAFSSEYIDQQTRIMLENQKTNPTESIGKAKELIESCCETILEKSGITPDDDWKLNQLVDETMKLLEITPKHIPDTAKESKAIKGILGSLKGIASQIAIVRNAYGSGHGKSASYQGLQERHAKLAIGSSVTLVNFLWDSFERKNG